MDVEERLKEHTRELGEFPSVYYYCLSCETAGKAIFDPRTQLKHFCPNCMASMMFYAFDWNLIRSDNPQFPKIPVEGKVYPLRHYPLPSFTPPYAGK